MPRRSYEPVGDAYRRAYDALHRRSDDADTLTAARQRLEAAIAYAQTVGAITPRAAALACRACGLRHD